MIGSSMNDALRILQGSWLKITGMVFLVYFIKILLETLPVQGTVSIQMDPFSVASSDTLISLAIAALVNSLLFYALVDYITLSEYTMRKRFVKACTYAFRNPKLLYKGWVVFFLINLLLYIMGMMTVYAGMGAVLVYASGIHVTSLLLTAAYAALYILLIWVYLGISQTMYVLYEDPDAGIFRSMKNSFSLMKGHKWPLLGLLVLSALAILLGIVLFVVGAIVALVLYEVARLAFYRDTLRKRRQREWREQVEGVGTG